MPAEPAQQQIGNLQVVQLDHHHVSMVHELMVRQPDEFGVQILCHRLVGFARVARVLVARDDCNGNSRQRVEIITCEGNSCEAAHAANDCPERG